MRFGTRTPNVDVARRPGSSERMLGSDGHINASTVQEAIRSMAELAQMIQAGQVLPDTEEETASAEERRAGVEVAFHEGGQAWMELGSSITHEINLRLEREGFMRSVLMRQDVQMGAFPRVKLREPKVKAVVSKGLGQIYPQYIRDTFFSPDEFWITANPRIEVSDLYTTGGDLLEDKYYDGLEAILVAEDRHLVNILRRADGLYNPRVEFNGDFNPAAFNAAKIQIEGWRLPVGGVIMAIDLWNDLATGNAFTGWFDPITKYEIVREGRLGRLLGMELFTDGFRTPSLKVLEPGEFFIVSDPEHLGAYTDRGPVESIPVDEMDKSVPARGWAMRERISQMVGNAKAVVHGVRR